MFVKLITFKEMMFLGYITPMNDFHEGRELFTLKLSDGSTVEYVYKEEILNYMDTGMFEYNEDLDYDTWTAVEEWEEDRD